MQGDLKTLRGMIEFGSTFAERWFNEHGRIGPMWHAVKENGEHFHFVMPSGMTKDQAADAVRAVFKRDRVVRCLFIDEAWIVEMRTKATMAEARVIASEALKAYGGSLANHPDRIEVVTFSGEDYREGVLLGERRIIRKINSRARLGPLEILDNPTQAEGRFVGMLSNLQDSTQ